jgi:hypothetical protein
MTRRQKRDFIADAQRFSSQSSFTRSWQISPFRGPNGLRFRGSARSFIRLLAGAIVLVFIVAVVLTFLAR